MIKKERLIKTTQKYNMKAKVHRQSNNQNNLEKTKKTHENQMPKNQKLKEK